MHIWSELMYSDNVIPRAPQVGSEPSTDTDDGEPTIDDDLISQLEKLSMDSGGWRSQSLPNSRQEITYKIFDTLKSHPSVSGDEELQELLKMAVTFEEKIYTSSTSQWDYLQKVSLRMLKVDTMIQNTVDNSLQPNPAEVFILLEQCSEDSPAQARLANEGDWQEEVYQKIKAVKEMYLPELSEMYWEIATKLQPHDSLPQQPKSERLEKLKMFKNILERLISVLHITKSSISPGLIDKLGSYENQIINFIDTNRPRKQVPPRQQGQLSPPHMHSMQQPQSQITQVQSRENQMNPLLQTMNLQASLDCRAQTGHANGSDSQEEVYQKIKVMKEMYLTELSEVYQKYVTKLQQPDSLPQPPKPGQLEKLKMFKTMLERLISVLQISKNRISPSLKGKLGLYEKQIVKFIITNRTRTEVPPLQQEQLPPPHMHYSMQQPQSQITQVQSHENPMNPQLQTMNLQGPVPTMQQNNNMTNLQENSLSSISRVSSSTAQHNMMNPLQPSTKLDPGQGNALNSLQQVLLGSNQQTPVNVSQQVNMNSNAMSSQSGVSKLQSNINSLQSNSGMLQHQQIEQQKLQNQLKQQCQQQMQHQLIQQRQILQQQQQQSHSHITHMHLKNQMNQHPLTTMLQSNPVSAGLKRDRQETLQAPFQVSKSMRPSQFAMDQATLLSQSQRSLNEALSSSRIARLHSTNRGPMAMMQQNDMTNLQKFSVSSLAGLQSMQFQGPSPMMQQNNMTSLQKNSDSKQSDSTAKTGDATEGNVPEEVYKKIKVMTAMYLSDLREMYQKIATQIQQHDSLPEKPTSEQTEKLKLSKTMLESLISVLESSECSMSPGKVVSSFSGLSIAQQTNPN
ncbi:mediator of RNA polymerase II transcription subunit 15a-like isoform X4 [Malus sylvestris]|uniref:mediator of RNA polymerase II transcription subunit 15a-like isoform X4 n=1 Tax=Malus sylvestris TaxID=3752 RepID=UPI0021AC12BE|nr:mediator of RNA polymerase II transcription subunit 15a-like isoform X4 [Malus sylvestris]